MRERGEIWLANLEPEAGSDPGRTLPVLIIQAQALLDVEHPATLIAPLTSELTDEAEPLRVRIPGNGALPDSADVVVDQLRAIDNRRLLRKLGTIDAELMARIDDALYEVLELRWSMLHQEEPAAVS